MKNIILALLLVFSLNVPAFADHVTVAEEDARIVYSVGVTPDDTFDIPFTFYDEDNIRVFVAGTELPADDFTVTGNPGTTGGYEGGTLVLDSAVTSSTVVVLLDIPLSRTTDFPVSGSFNITSLNTQFDKLVSMQQVMDAKYKRALKLPETSELLDDDGAAIDLVFLEDPTDGSIFYYSASGGGFVNGADGSTLEADLATLDTDLATASAAAVSASASASAAAASAATLTGTSTSNVLIGTGSKSFTTQSGKQFSGSFVTIASAADATNNMFGLVTSYSGTTLTVDVTATSGTGTFADWVITVAGARGATGAQGPQGAAGSGTGDMLGANNLTDLTNAGTARTNLGLGTIATQNSNGVTVTGGTITGITDLAIADGGTGASTASAAFDALKQAASESATGVVELATVAECTTGTDTERACTPAGVAAAVSASSAITLGTPQNTTSGTAINFTSIPAGTKRLTVNFNGVSTNGTSHVLIQLGDSGGIENTGYSGAGSQVVGTVATTNSTAGFILLTGGAGTLRHGTITLTLHDPATNTWTASGVTAGSDNNSTYPTGGSKALSASLDRLRITTVNGTDTFDAGSINIIYE